MLQKVTIHENTPNRHQSYLFRAGYDKGVRTHHPGQHQHPALKGRQGSRKALSHKKGQAPGMFSLDVVAMGAGGGLPRNGASDVIGLESIFGFL